MGAQKACWASEVVVRTGGEQAEAIGHVRRACTKDGEAERSKVAVGGRGQFGCGGEAASEGGRAGGGGADDKRACKQTGVEYRQGRVATDDERVNAGQGWSGWRRRRGLHGREAERARSGWEKHRG